MDQASIAELLIPFLETPVSSHQSPAPGFETQNLLPDISTFIDILVRWTAKMNLTAIRDPEEIVTRHFGESLFAARHLFPNGNAAGGPFKPAVGLSGARQTRSAQPARREETQQERSVTAATGGPPPAPDFQLPSLADVGSGAGFPGIPIKLWTPQIALTLIESNHKKVAFLREVARALTLTNINIQNTRVEVIPPASFDVVTLRAVERFENVLPAAGRLVAPGGRLSLLVSSAQLETVARLMPAFGWQEPIPIPHSSARVLAIATAGL